MKQKIFLKFRLTAKVEFRVDFAQPQHLGMFNDSLSGQLGEYKVAIARREPEFNQELKKKKKNDFVPSMNSIFCFFFVNLLFSLLSKSSFMSSKFSPFFLHSLFFILVCFSFIFYFTLFTLFSSLLSY